MLKINFFVQALTSVFVLQHQEKADVEITDVNEDLNDVKSIDLTDKLDDDIWVISMNSDSSINIVAVKINHKVSHV